MSRRTIKLGGAPLRGPMRVLSVALCGVFLIVLARSWNAPPSYEAFATLQTRPGAESVALIESRLFTRDMLEATAARHGLASPLALSAAIALQPLTSAAGESLGLPERAIGLVVAVRLTDPDAAMRVANDVALQILDLAHAGRADAEADRLSFYRAEENRLWQESAALRSDPALDAQGQRRLRLMEAEYAQVTAALAADEVAARADASLHRAPWLILARATEARLLAPVLRIALGTLAAGALALALMSSLIGREISLPSRPAPSANSGRSRSS